MPKRNYPTDLTDCQWQFLTKLFEELQTKEKQKGRPKANLRQIVNGIFYLNKTGCQWRMLPNDFEHWNTTYHYFNAWSKSGLWEEILDTLRKLERESQGRKASPSAICVDSQSIKTGTQSKDVGFDGGKMVKGRKRHIFVDTLGILLAVVVTSANTNDRDGYTKLLGRYLKKGVTRLRKIWADKGYSGPSLKFITEITKATHKIDLEIKEREGKGFSVVRKRWVVERTFAWLINFRRNAKDYELRIRNSEAMLKVSMIQILLARYSTVS